MPAADCQERRTCSSKVSRAFRWSTLVAASVNGCPDVRPRIRSRTAARSILTGAEDSKVVATTNRSFVGSSGLARQGRLSEPARVETYCRTNWSTAEAKSESVVVERLRVLLAWTNACPSLVSPMRMSSTGSGVSKRAYAAMPPGPIGTADLPARICTHTHAETRFWKLMPPWVAAPPPVLCDCSCPM